MKIRYYLKEKRQEENIYYSTDDILCQRWNDQRPKLPGIAICGRGGEHDYKEIKV